MVSFQVKKINLETLPEYLKEIRTGLNLSLEEVGKRTGISIYALKALESGSFHKLPSEVYVRGFLAKLSLLYRIDKELLIKQYEIERQVEKNVKKFSSTVKSKKKTFWESLVITPKSLSIAGAVAFVVFSVFYIIWQVLSISRVPVLEIEYPQDLTVVDKSFVEVSGRTDAGATITINNEPVFVDPEGRFKASLGLSSGPKELIVVAKNRFNKISSKTLTVLGQSKMPNLQQGVIRLVLEFSQNVDIGYKSDEAGEVVRQFGPGEKLTLEARRVILLSASDASAVKATLDGQSMGILGRPGEKLIDIPFSKESANIK